MSKRPGANNDIGCGTCLLSIGALIGMVALVPGLYALATEGFDEAKGFLLLSAMLVGGCVPLAVILSRRNRRLKMRQLEDKAPVLSWRDHPRFPALKTKRGTRGVKLATDFGVGCRVVLIILLAAIWNGISIAAFVGLWNESGSGWNRFFGLSCVSVFLLIGLLLIYGAIHQVLLILMTGRTGVEISNEPVRPGEEVKGWLYQAGYYDITSAKVVLKCTEAVTYRQGTNTTTHHEMVLEETVLEREGLRAMGQDAFVSFQFRLPEDAMHSFKATKNAVVWQLEVTLDIPGRPDVSEKYPFRVAPEVRQ